MLTIFCNRARGGTFYVKFFVLGRERRVSLRTTDRTTAERLARKYREIADSQPRLVGASTITILDMLEQYLAWAARHGRRKQTTDSRRRAAARFAKIHAGSVATITRRTVLRYRDSILTAGGSNRTANESISALRAIVERCKREELFDGTNPFVGIDALPESPKNERYLTAAEIEVLLEHAAPRRDLYLFVALGVHAGLRKNEIIQARWDWIDFDQHVINVFRQKPGKAKTPGSVRTVPLRDVLADILKPFAGTGFIIAPESKSVGRYRFDPKKAFKTLCRESGISGVTPHTLRHTFASQCAIAGIDLYRIGRWMGHSSPLTTARYAHLQAADDAVNRW